MGNYGLPITPRNSVFYKSVPGFIPLFFLLCFFSAGSAPPLPPPCYRLCRSCAVRCSAAPRHLPRVPLPLTSTRRPDVFPPLAVPLFAVPTRATTAMGTAWSTAPRRRGISRALPLSFRPLVHELVQPVPFHFPSSPSCPTPQAPDLSAVSVLPLR
jgi:hypothetical protein